ncbi:MAG: MurT ligase domain-containing protein [Patescibacteria group bacterium]
MNFLIIFVGKLFSSFIRLLNLGNGSTWPGHIALILNPNFIEETLSKSKVKKVVIIGTNGKTTTSKLIRTIFKANKSKSVYNMSGANLLNGIASSIIISSKFDGELKKDFALFEIDENAFPLVSEKIKPDFVIALNLFRDQLDRYGEIDQISSNWKRVIDKLDDTVLILNSDDPQIAFLGKERKKNVCYFGLEEKTLEKNVLQHGADSILCPKCSSNLNFSSYYFSHLGHWKCPNCKFTRPKPDLSKLSYYPLKGTYALYDILAAVLFAQVAGIKKSVIESALKEFKPAFGRQETLNYMGKEVQIFLSKNPISFNESLSTVKSLGGKNIVIVLNDKIPDGLDVSWIWDIDFENILTKDINIIVTGERMYDMAVRLKYAGFFAHVSSDMKLSIDKMIENLSDNEKLYILPNYSAMLEVRQLLTGKKIL